MLTQLLVILITDFVAPLSSRAGRVVAQLAEAVCYEPEGRKFDPR